MGKKKILFITQKRNDAIGGVDENIKKELLSIKHNFDFFEVREKGNLKFSIILNYIINILNILIKSFGYKKVYFTWENPYVIFLRFLYPFKNIIMCVHHVENYWGKSIVGKILLKSVNKIIAISKFTKKQLIHLGVNKNDIVVNYNGISRDFYFEKEKNYKYDYILYVGTELKRKNIINLVKAFKKINKKYPKIKLLKLGLSGEKNIENKLDNFIRKNFLEKGVIVYRKKFNYSELRKYYSNAICYISVSKLEGFGLTIPEALACGCPVVASNIPPFKEILGDSQIIVNPENINDIYMGMIKYIEDKSFRKKMGKEGIKISKKFNWEKNVKNLINIIEKDK